MLSKCFAFKKDDKKITNKNRSIMSIIPGNKTRLVKIIHSFCGLLDHVEKLSTHSAHGQEPQTCDRQDLNPKDGFLGKHHRL